MLFVLFTFLAYKCNQANTAKMSKEGTETSNKQQAMGDGQPGGDGQP